MYETVNGGELIWDGDLPGSDSVAGKASGGAMRCTQREYSAIRFQVSCYRPANLVRIVSDSPLVSLRGELHLRGELL